jgi:hypothetical protein
MNSRIVCKRVDVACTCTVAVTANPHKLVLFHSADCPTLSAGRVGVAFMAATTYWGVVCNGGEFHPCVEVPTGLENPKPHVETFTILCTHGGGECTPQAFGPEHLMWETFPGPYPGFKTHPAFIGKQTAA